MSDRFAAQITIGGCISRALVPALCAALRKQRATLDWGETPFLPQTVDDLRAARRVVDGEEVLQLCDAETRHGRFDDLEPFLVKRRVPFDRRTEGFLDRSPQLVAYRPESQLVNFTTDGGEIVLPALPLWEFGAELERFRSFLHRLPKAASRDELSRLVDAFRMAVPYRPSSLPAFEIGRTVGLRTAA